MRRGYKTEHYSVRPLADTSYGFAFESDNHPNQYYRDGGLATNNHHHTYYIPVIAKTTTTRSTVDFPHHQHPNLHDQRRDHWPESTGHVIYPQQHSNLTHDQRRDHWPDNTIRVISPQQHPNLIHDQRRDHWPESTDRVISVEHDNHVNQNQYQHGQHAKGGDYLDYVSRLEKMPSIYVGAPPQVQNQHAMQDKQVTYEEYVTSDEEYDSDAQEMVKMKITTRVEKRAVKW
ncbi:hypothetical protein FRX31_024599 [Thalictrum thalictroides]|uniref:Uncharacterized protein n=1 Tax=Thalictrum thalictroides TaxID=46969 RepID=A0A7J6VL06_THATH|nr:hypothetical protein FRX31_024599 [Thalictrum thalictroides]